VTRSRVISSELKTIVHVFSGDLWAGAEQMIYGLLRELQKRKDYDILALAMTGGTLSRKLNEAGISCHVLDESTGSFPALVMRAYSLLRGRNVGLLHAHRYKENLLAGLLGKLLGVRALVSTMHGSSERTAGGSRCPSTKVEKLNYYVLKNWYARVVPVSMEMKRHLVTGRVFDEDHLTVIHNGIALQDGPCRVRPDRPIFHIGTAGRLVEIKGLDLFIDVAAAVQKQEANVQFHILGDGPLRQELVYAVKRMGLDSVIIFEGYREQARTFYEDMDIYLNTSHHEGLPLSILEAMAVETPIVAPNVGGIAEVISDGVEGFLIDGRSSEDFAARCLTLIRNPQVRATLGMNARRKVQAEYSCQGMAAAYENLYKEVIGSCIPDSQKVP